MIQEITPHRFANEYRAQMPEPEANVLAFRGDAVLCAGGAGHLTLPRWGALGLPADRGRFAFLLDGAPVFLTDAEPERLPEGFAFVSAPTLRHAAPRHIAWAVGVGGSLMRWYRQNALCGACGEAMVDSTTERARICPRCGAVVYPRINPAVIAAVHDGDRLLLTRYRGRAHKAYSLVAGFNEIGESIEDTVRREVMEEAGLRVKNLRFYRSQPWVFTDSLLMGFFAELDGPDEIRMEEDELSEAGWIHRDSLPEDHSDISLTGEMIELFRGGREPH